MKTIARFNPNNCKIFTLRSNYIKSTAGQKLSDIDRKIRNNTYLAPEQLLEIVLWKVNRTVQSQDVLRILHHYKVSSWTYKRLNTIRYNITMRSLCRELQFCHGVQLPMMSTILRFLNPLIFQIIDRRAYRVIMGHRLEYKIIDPPENRSNCENADKNTKKYIKYLEKIHLFCARKNSKIKFHEFDQIAYQFDVESNKNVGINEKVRFK